MPLTAKSPVGTKFESPFSVSTRRLWDVATNCGQPNATTTFSDVYNKDDFTYIDNETYEGDRAKSLGYLTQIKLIKFLRTELGSELTGVDFSKTGAGGAEREGRLRTIGSELFELLVGFSHKKECKLGDVNAVSKERGMAPDKFVLYSGWSKALASKDYRRLRKKWRVLDGENMAKPQSTPMVRGRVPIVVGVELPRAAAPAPAPAPAPKVKDPVVVDIDGSDGDEPPALAPEPVPDPVPEPVPEPAPAGPSTMHVDSSGLESSSTVFMQTEHEESMNFRTNAPDQHLAQASDPNPDYDASVALAMQLQEEEDSLVETKPVPAPAPPPAEAVPNPKPAKRRASASAVWQKEAKKVRKEGPRAPAPPPASAAAPAATTWATSGSFTDDDWRALGMDILTKYQAAKAKYKTNKYDAENTPILNAQSPLYHIKTQRRVDGKSSGQQDTDVHFALHSPLHKILKKTKLRSVPDIKRAFGLP